MARPVRAGARRRSRVRRHMVEHDEREVARRRTWRRALVADRVERPHLSHHGPRRRRESLDAGVQAHGWREAVGDRGAVARYRARSTEEQPRVGDRDDRRRAHLRLVRHARPCRAGFLRKDRLAREAGRPRQLSRQCRIPGPVQGPRLPLSGPRRHLDVALLCSRLRQADRQDALDDGRAPKPSAGARRS